MHSDWHSIKNIIPILKNIPSRFPGAGFKRYTLKQADTVENDLLKKPYEKAKSNFVSSINTLLTGI